ncbi:MAG: hypothetical protein LBR65_04245 [Culturomica sp.]|jgi:gas vesicle protein|nr:hypothetical protein [Culturomica sp.]
MKHENSHGQLFTGMLFGALVGACATYLIVKNKDSIQKYWEDMNEKMKDGMHRFADKANELKYKAKEKADELTQKAKEKMHAAEEVAECLEEKLHHPTTHRTTAPKK